MAQVCPEPGSGLLNYSGSGPRYVLNHLSEVAQVCPEPQSGVPGYMSQMVELTVWMI